MSDVNEFTTGVLIGYARVSKEEQRLDLQVDALRKAGCVAIYSDKLSGSKISRDGLDECLATLKRNDTLVVWKLDRLGRNTSHLVKTLDDLKNRGIKFISLKEGFDTSTPLGKTFYYIAAIFAELERESIQERTVAGLKAARARGRIGGRREVVEDKDFQMAKKLLLNPEITVRMAAKTIGVGKSTLYNRLKEEKEGKDVRLAK